MSSVEDEKSGSDITFQLSPRAYSPSRTAGFNALATILETDDIGSESQIEEAGTSEVRPADSIGTVGSDNFEAAGPSTSTEQHYTRFSSLITQVKRRSQFIMRMSAKVMSQSASGVTSCLQPKGTTLSAEAIRAMPLRVRINFYLSQPEESIVGWVFHHFIIMVLVVNLMMMASQTLDGPRFVGSDPAYPYLPKDPSYTAAEALFTIIYVVEFLGRWISSKSWRLYWKSFSTWICLFALIPFFVIQALNAINSDNSEYDRTGTQDSVNWLRLLRVIRVIQMSHVYVGSKVMLRATSNAIAPLKITMFFLVTVVMVFATAIFYAEPCYDLNTCTFTDIFNAGYYVMITVATVGYGSQVPSLYNGGSLVLASMVMIFGTLYISMPLAIVGIKYEFAWREHDEKLLAEQQKKPKTLAEVSIALAAASKRGDSEDETLKPLETRKVFTLSYNICDRFYELSQKLVEVNESIQKLLYDPNSSSPEAVSARAKARGELTVKLLESIMGVLKLHKRVCSDIRGLIPLSDQRRKSISRDTSGKLSFTNLETSFKTGYMTMFNKAKRKLHSMGSRNLVKTRLHHQGPVTFRSRVWDIFEHNDFSRRTNLINRFRLYMVVLSIVLFYAQTTPELQDTGLRTVLCRRTIADFCSSYDRPACYVYNASGVATLTRVDFHCKIDSTDSKCYGAGYNYGSANFTLDCREVFGREGGKRVCNNRLCKATEGLIIDMEPYWVYFEFVFGIFFTTEMVLRAYVHPQRKLLLHDLTLLLDIIVLFPFYVEFFEIVIGIMPIYSIVPTAPSFFTGVRVLKTFRILKLGTHIPGARVLTKTALLTYQRLMIPLFFLFIGCVISAAIFYELERGTECFVGKKCMWWGKNVLTKYIAGDLPDGKRILVQNTMPSIITDMLRSTWFSLVTFTTVGYGDLVPRTPLGRLVDIFGMIFSACYTAMPLTLVGGQFYVCYEVYVQEEKRRRPGAENSVEPKQRQILSEAKNGSGRLVSLSVKTSPEHSTRPAASDAPDTLSDVLSAGSELTSIMSAPVDSVANTTNSKPNSLQTSANSNPQMLQRGLRRRAEATTPSPPVIANVDMQYLNQFALIFNVFNELIEDLSKLNRVFTQRSGSKKDLVNGEKEAQLTESDIQKKISENMVFCITVLLNFAPVIERIVGETSESPAPHLAVVPSIIHATATGGESTTVETEDHKKQS